MGLIREGRDMLRALQPDIRTEGLLQASYSLVPVNRNRMSTSVDLPLSKNAKRVLAYAGENSERFGHQEIDTHHFLLALLRQNGASARFLQQYGFDLKTTREKVRNFVSNSSGQTQSASQRSKLRQLIASLPDAKLEMAIALLSEMIEEKFLMRKVSIAEKLATFHEYYKPHIVGELNGQHVKVVKVKGDFVWHHHEHEDEMFLIIKGALRMDYREDGEEKTMTLQPGEFVIVPRGMEHKPSAEDEVHLMLFEPAGTLNTGNVRSELTVDEPATI